jgi:hypothetical protein
LCFVVSIFRDLCRMTVRAIDLFRPTKLTNHLVTFRVMLRWWHKSISPWILTRILWDNKISLK